MANYWRVRPGIGKSLSSALTLRRSVGSAWHKIAAALYFGATTPTALAGTVSATATATAAFAMAVPVLAAAVSIATATGSTAVALPVQAVTLTQASASGGLGLQLTLSGSAVMTALATGAAGPQAALAGHASAGSSPVGALAISMLLAGDTFAVAASIGGISLAGLDLALAGAAISLVEAAGYTQMTLSLPSLAAVARAQVDGAISLTLALAGQGLATSNALATLSGGVAIWTPTAARTGFAARAKTVWERGLCPPRVGLTAKNASAWVVPKASDRRWAILAGGG